MDWTAKQGHILTGGGTMERFYKPPRFPFVQDELPHYHLVHGTTRQAFRAWLEDNRRSSLACGAWTRGLFVGGWHHTDNIVDEDVFNLQTPSVFIDIRIPKARPFGPHQSLSTMSGGELSAFARRHAFGGYSLFTNAVCTRHHCIDWNFTAVPRPRPNKWRVEMREDGDAWKEWSWAKDDHDQHVYMERWERLPNGKGPFLALRTAEPAGADALLVVVGDHFNYLRDRPALPRDVVGLAPSTTALVDALVSRGDDQALNLARQWLSLEACHGRVSGATPWTIDASLHPWHEGQPLQGIADAVVHDNAKVVVWRGQSWDVLENSFGPPHALRALFQGKAPLAARL